MNSKTIKVMFFFLKSLGVVALLFLVRESRLASLAPLLLAALAWWMAELAISKKANPLAGPWAVVGSEREQALRILWPLWRFGFLINCLAMLNVAISPPANWLVQATLFPWIIFTTLGFLSALLHTLAKDLPTLASWVGVVQHFFYLFIGFTPFVIGCVISFFVMPLIWIISLFDWSKSQRRCRKIVQNTFKIILHYLNQIGFVSVKFANPTQIPPQYLLIGNHISMFDVISVIAHVDNCNTFVKEKYTRIPFLIPAIFFCGYIPVNPSNVESCRLGLKAALKAIRNGESFVAWPEGTRAVNGVLGPFNNGVFGIALETSTPIYPVIFKSSDPLFNNQGMVARHSQRIEFQVTVLEPIPLSPDIKKSPTEVVRLRETVRSVIQSAISSEPHQRILFNGQLTECVSI